MTKDQRNKQLTPRKEVTMHLLGKLDTETDIEKLMGKLCTHFANGIVQIWNIKDDTITRAGINCFRAHTVDGKVDPKCRRLKISVNWAALCVVRVDEGAVKTGNWEILKPLKPELSVQTIDISYKHYYFQEKEWRVKMIGEADEVIHFYGFEKPVPTVANLVGKEFMKIDPIEDYVRKYFSKKTEKARNEILQAGAN